MRAPSSTAGRMRNEAAIPSPARFDGRNWPAMKRTGEVRQLPAPARAVVPALPPLRTVQNACYEALSLALKEGHVFAALTGPEGSGKTTVLEAVLADRRDRALRCIRISDPDKVPASLADQIEQVAYAEASKPENLERHIVLVVDDAQTASAELLTCLSRLAAMREPGRRVPQVLLVGRPELWNRLAEEAYEPLTRRLAIRAALPAAEDDHDPWAVVENDVTQTMTQLRAEAENMPMVLDPGETDYDHEAVYAPEYGFGAADAGSSAEHHELTDEEIPPPAYALFPDPTPMPTRPARRESRRRLVMPLVSLFVGLAAFAFALSFYDWPDTLDDMPWSNPKPVGPFSIPVSPQAQTFGVPLPPSSMMPGKTPAAPKKSAAAPVPAPVMAPAQTATATPATTPATPPITTPISTSISTPAAPSAAVAPIVVAPVAVAPPVVASAPAVHQPDATAAPARESRPAETAALAVSPVIVAPPPPVIRLVPAPSQPPASVVSPPTPAAAPPATASATPPAPAVVTAARVPVVEPTLSPVLLSLLLRRGDEQVAIGDISAARLLYERAAESGSGVAANQLGRTFDPAFLPPATEGTLANISRARFWYQRAAALGQSDAIARLKTLNQGR